MGPVIEDPERCYAAVASRDPRFDGWFITGVTSTGIYCRPSCPATTPKRSNVRFFPTAAAAQGAGFRSCKRCRPDATPGSPEWDARADVVARAMRLIADGTVDRHGVAGLAARLGYSARQLQRLLMAEVGAGPQALARAQRAQSARVLIETTDLPFADVAFAAGFGSIRQFNDTVQVVFDRSPGALRSSGRGHHGPPGDGCVRATGEVSLRLAHRSPLASDALMGFLVGRAVAGVEAPERDDAGNVVGLHRTLDLPCAPATVRLTPADGHVRCTLRLGDTRDVTAAVARCRRLLDLDADPVAVDAALSEDPVLAPVVALARGRRVPRTVDEDELAVRAVLGQQVSTAAARTHAGRLVQAHGEPVADPAGGLTHLFPDAQRLAALDPATLALPRARQRAVTTLVEALAAGSVRLDPGSDWAEARAGLLALPGLGPWTVEVVAMRALGDPDAFLATDLGVRLAARGLGLPLTPGALTARSTRWAPWRSYAVQYLWATGTHAVNRLPAA